MLGHSAIIRKMNNNHLLPTTLASHAALLVVILSQLITKEDLSDLQIKCVVFISISLPVMILAYVMNPSSVTYDRSYERIYMILHPIAHGLGIVSLSYLFSSISIVSGRAYGITSTICLLVLIVKQLQFHMQPAVREAVKLARK